MLYSFYRFSHCQDRALERDRPQQRKKNPHGFVWFLFGVAPAPFCVVSLFFCWRNANLAGRFAGRRCCRVFSLCFGLTMMCLVYEAKVFHLFCTLFYRFSHCQDRALERDRPQQEKTMHTKNFQQLQSECQHVRDHVHYRNYSQTAKSPKRVHITSPVNIVQQCSPVAHDKD